MRFWEGLITGLVINVIMMFVIKFITMLAGLSCHWSVAFVIAALITWVGVVIISVSDGEIDFW